MTDVPNSLRHVLAGATSGALGVTILAPVELLRVNMMLNRDWSLKTAFDSLKSGWFRGNTADVLAASMRVGITMPTFALYKALLRQTLRDRIEPGQPLPQWATFVAGALAGCTASVACYPLEVARTRLAIACNVEFGLFGCLYMVAREEGALAMYNGLLTTLAGVLPFNAVKLSTYDRLRRQATLKAAKSTDNEDAVSLPVPTIAAIGAVSGVSAATACYPLEVVRRQQMAGNLASNLSPVSAVVQVRTLCLRALCVLLCLLSSAMSPQSRKRLTSLCVCCVCAQLVKKEGPQILVRGVGLNVVKVSLGNSVGFVLYELAKDCLEVDGRVPPWRQKAA